jgi:hypothetical protein
MTRIVSLLTLVATVFVCLLPAAPALAQRARVFVASYGSDSNSCTFGSPCKTFQQAVNVVAQGGEVTAIDSAGFGPIIISHGVTITSPNGVEAGIAAPANGGAAITINAGTDDIIDLSGLTLDGDGVANTTGILFNTGGTLNVHNSVIRRFGNIGINFQPSGAGILTVTDTLVSDQSAGPGTGILAASRGTGQMSVLLKRTNLFNNALGGIVVTANQSTSGVSVAVLDSVVSNTASGLVISFDSPDTPLTGLLDNSSLIAGSPNNTSLGLFINGPTSDSTQRFVIARSTILGWNIALDSTLGADNLVSLGSNFIPGPTQGGCVVLIPGNLISEAPCVGN